MYLKKKMLKFDQKEVTMKGFHGQRPITDIFTIEINKLVDLIRCHAIMKKTVVIL